MSRDEARLTPLRALLADHAGDVAELLAEAREEARDKVRSLLVEALTDSLLEQVGERVAVTAAAPARPGRGADAVRTAAASGDLGWYVYCVVGAERVSLPTALAGIDSAHPVSVLSRGDIAAVVSRVALNEFGEEPLRERLADMAWLERTARAHEDVLDVVARQTTPIPMRLCTIYRDEDGVQEMLERESAGLAHGLAHLDGKLEWGVKAFGDLDAAGEEVAPLATVAADGEGAAYMQSRLGQRRRREEAQRQLQTACEAIHESLCAVSAEAITSPPQRPEVAGREIPMILNGSYLVPAGDREAFHNEVARLQAEFTAHGITLESTGPWPPYNFVPGAIGAAW
jgi:hypothetical protein